MSELTGRSIYAWVALPTVMYGGYARLGLLTKKNALAPFGPHGSGRDMRTQA